MSEPAQSGGVAVNLAKFLRLEPSGDARIHNVVAGMVTCPRCGTGVKAADSVTAGPESEGPTWHFTCPKCAHRFDGVARVDVPVAG